jgi:hypothetical protein
MMNMMINERMFPMFLHVLYGTMKETASPQPAQVPSDSAEDNNEY